MAVAAESEIAKNKLHVNWSDSTFFPWLNPVTVLDYFCDTRNPFYNSQCNNQLLKMQGMSCTIEQLSNMPGIEYQLHISQPPLYVIRKVNRKSSKDITPLGYYYILHGVVYQAPDFMSILSSRLQTSSFYLNECLELSFKHYKYHPSKGYYWDFNVSNDEAVRKDLSQQKQTQFHHERVDLMIQEFLTKYQPQVNVPQHTESSDSQNSNKTNQSVKPMQQVNGTVNEINSDQPVEKKMKLNYNNKT